MAKPGAFELTKQSLDFFKENRDVFIDRLKIFLPIGIVLIASTHIGVAYESKQVQFLILLPMILLQAYFCLSWSRLSLQERNAGSLKPSAKDLGFVATFLGLMIAPALPSLLFTAYVMFRNAQGDPFDAKSFVPYVHVCTLAAFVGVLHFIFLIPARAVGTDISALQALRAGRGIRLKLVGGFLIFLLCLVITFYLYSAAIGVVVMAFGEAANPALWLVILGGTALSVPVFVGILVFIALVTTMICRAYEWGLANNSV